MNKTELNTFINLLQKVRKEPNKTFDLGLIIKEPQSNEKVEEIFNELKNIVEIERIIYDKLIMDEEVFEKMIEVFQKGKWIFLEIKKDISSPLLNQLKHLANYNSFQLLGFKGKNVFEMKMPENSRLIVFVERDFVENKISYPHFYTLFGPTLTLK